ncbi:LolA-like outer membrane lipoprotein chaperone [Helicobacter turcicus]|uniref:LolA-like outer membrane lipoprotein chaperone n=1 Tax=Helicobacter turcicus TaxID=2867412 RepID=A0ABS7JKF7_9HELI|nr:LolA-like outer membrane lipoprotein chaperone [Helicobacter turcicus]MBX7489873.1 LolA-like outer membrane lipoprotein chaperone [Helicobacter turcicus]MBX7544733.1 LolA-like outer membrane lipoprotein chaperone [Helicobacter turcicus]
MRVLVVLFENLLKIGIFFCFLSVMIQAKDLQTIQSFSANFEQRVYSSENEGSTLKYTGTIKALAPSSVLWKYDEPIPKEIYIDNGTMIVFEPKLQQAIFTQLQENMDLLSLLKKARKVKENHYEAVILEQKYTLLLSNGILKEVRFSDDLGNKVEIIFSNIVVDSKIDAGIFEFNPSSDIDIIYY